MLYKGNSCEVVGEKEVFGQRIAWIRLLEDNSLLEVPYEDLEKSQSIYSIPYLRFISIAAKIELLFSKTGWGSGGNFFTLRSFSVGFGKDIKSLKL